MPDAVLTIVPPDVELTVFLYQVMVIGLPAFAPVPSVQLRYLNLIVPAVTPEQ